ncbi:MAG: hypothetical protein HY313_11060 [Acidobacteria bacterium]|nr:hypothetical protein [Acidobacteriota bacterium]
MRAAVELLRCAAAHEFNCLSRLAKPRQPQWTVIGFHIVGLLDVSDSSAKPFLSPTPTPVQVVEGYNALPDTVSDQKIRERIFHQAFNGMLVVDWITPPTTQWLNADSTLKEHCTIYDLGEGGHGSISCSRSLRA